MKKISLLIVLVSFIGISSFAQEPEYLDEASFKKKVFNYDKNSSWSTNWQYNGDTPAIVDFYADWCGPCKYVSPFLEEIAKEYGTKIKVYKVNTDNYPRVASAFGVRGIPTFLFIPANGKPKKMVGAMAKSGFETEITNYLKLTK